MPLLLYNTIILLFTPNSVTSNDYSPFKMPLQGRGCNHSITNTMMHSLRLNINTIMQNVHTVSAVTMQVHNMSQQPQDHLLL